MKVARLTCLLALIAGAGVARGATKITFDPAGTMLIDGKPTFVISFGYAPPTGGKTPDGKDALAEVREAGANFFRIPPPEKWDSAGEAEVRRWLDAGAAHGMYGWISLRGIEKFKTDDDPRAATLRQVVAMFKDHPALGGYKGSDEPAWGKVPLDSVVRAYRVLHEVDPDHPVNVGHAPKLSPDKISPYMVACDITGSDIFPIAYPPGKHSDLPNKELSVVADETDKIVKIANGKSVWMALQIAWSGVSRPGQNTLRFPTFPQERYMTYAAIIHGARGINYFGGQIEQDLSPEDAKLGWNWRFWNRVLKQVIEEIGDKSPLHPALLVPDAKIPVKLDGAKDVDFCVREVGDDLFILAAKREGETAQTTFRGLPLSASSPIGEVLFESPRTVKADGDSFTDWFAPNEVHVYRFKKAAAK